MINRYIIVLLAILFVGNVNAAENYFLSLKYKKVNVRYGPGIDFPIKFIYSKKNFPVEIIDKKENFRKIEDYKKNSGWIHISQLKKSMSTIVLSEKILYKKPTRFSKPLALVDPGRLLKVSKCNSNWCKVHTGNITGWVEKENLWGI